MKGSWISVFCLITIAMVMMSCATTQQQATPAPVDTRAQDEAAIRATAQEWGKAVNEKNLEQTLSYYADDAWVNPQNAPIAKTADERRNVWAAFFAIPGSDMEGGTTRVEVARSGDLAVEYGIFTMTTKDKKGKPSTVAEKYVATWKKQADGKWKVIADIWNSDK